MTGESLSKDFDFRINENIISEPNKLGLEASELAGGV